jgi:mRNA interferase MazF
MRTHRGEIFRAYLPPFVGHEIDPKKGRPVVVLSINEINSKPLVVTVVPGTSWTPGEKIFRNEVKVDPSTRNGLDNATLFQCHQIKSIDHLRFQHRVGTLSPDELKRLEEVVGYCLGLRLQHFQPPDDGPG